MGWWHIIWKENLGYVAFNFSHTYIIFDMEWNKVSFELQATTFNGAENELQEKAREIFFVKF